MKKRLVLIDANALIHRSFHALPPLTTKKGELVNAVYGFTSVMLRVLKELKPDYIVTTFDLPKPTFRHREYKAYKATRPKTPEELSQQFSKVKEVIKAFDIPIFEKEGFEADDIIGTIVKKTGKDIEDIVVTGDLDTLQLVDENTKVYTLKKGITDTVIYDEKAVDERYGLKPEQLVDFKGLKGDPSDNIPGVPGIGEKTAIKLLQQFGSLEDIYKEIQNPKSKIQDPLKARLLENKAQAIFSKKLATIRYDVPIKFNLKDCETETYDKQQVIKLFQELDFKSLINRLPERQQPISQSLFDSSKKGPIDKQDENRFEDIKKAYKEKILSKITYQLEKELVPVLEEMETAGIKLDIDFLKELSKKLNFRLEELERKIYKLAGVKFNINSPQQLSEILFAKLKISIDGLKKTPGGVISTAASELFKLKGCHEIIDLILEYRELMKLKTTYVDTLPNLVDDKSRVHTTYHQLGTATGRFSSSDPNLQNIPIRTEWGGEIRKAFIAENGYKLISADYSQIELRVAACLAKDKKMIAAFKKDYDIHKLTAAEVNNISLDKVTDKMRYEAKALNFGVLYGMSVIGFSEAAGISRERAKKFIDEYMRDFVGIAKYVEKTKKEAKKKEYVETILGRRRYLPQINSSDFLMRHAAERMAINMPVQGTAADIMKVAMIEVNKKLKKEKLDAKILLQVHDELVLEVKEDKKEEAAKIIKEAMEDVLNTSFFKSVKSIFKIPQKVDIKVGDNWGVCQSYPK